MKSIDELDYYELLEVSRNATANEIGRAYRLAQQTYADGSLALYSVFGDLDAAAIRSRLDDAYRVLSDPETREAHDREFHSNGALDASTEDSLATSHADSTLPGSPGSAGSPTAADSQTGERAFDAFDEIVEEFDALEDETSGDFDGVRLRRTRLFRGYEIEDIADVTKVSGSHLRNIEEENFIDLPADVYVRGFVTAYAKTIGLDPQVVVPSYMARVTSSRDAGQRGRFLGRS
jgi:curved DNA-binding protein CbpA